MTLREQRKGKPTVPRKTEQDRSEGMVQTGPDFGAEVDENLYKVRKNAEEKSMREEGQEQRETIS
jgi:hypothetical protein